MSTSTAVWSGPAGALKHALHRSRRLGGLQVEAVLTHLGGTTLLKFQAHVYIDFSRRADTSLLPGAKLSSKLTLPNDDGESLFLHILARAWYYQSLGKFFALLVIVKWYLPVVLF